MWLNADVLADSLFLMGYQNPMGKKVKWDEEQKIEEMQTKETQRTKAMGQELWGMCPSCLRIIQ